MVGYPSSGFSRNTLFYEYINTLEIPCDNLRMSPNGLSPAVARNMIFSQAILHNCTHVFLVDDDMALKPDTLKKLLAHDKDIVSGLYLSHAFPHQPLAFDTFDEKGAGRYLSLNQGIKGLIKIKAAGFGCCLIKTDVIKKMERPWVRLGELNPEQWCDDIGFFWRLNQNHPEVEVFLDTNTRVGHIKQLILWPHQFDGSWMTGYNASGQVTIYVPQTDTSKLEIDGILAASQIEGWMTDQELRWLAKTAKDKKLIVEFGSHCGKSTRALADNSPADALVIAVDPWSGEYFNQNDDPMKVLGGSRFDDFQQNLFNHINVGKVLPVRKFSHDFKLEHRKADFVFIDGDHRYESVLNDINNALSMADFGAVISGHDYNHEEWPGVAQAVNEIFGKENINLDGTIWWVKLNGNH
jgi:hypothetical protein